MDFDLFFYMPITLKFQHPSYLRHLTFVKIQSPRQDLHQDPQKILMQIFRDL